MTNTGYDLWSALKPPVFVRSPPHYDKMERLMGSGGIVPTSKPRQGMSRDAFGPSVAELNGNRDPPADGAAWADLEVFHTGDAWGGADVTVPTHLAVLAAIFSDRVGHLSELGGDIAARRVTDPGARVRVSVEALLELVAGDDAGGSYGWDDGGDRAWLDGVTPDAWRFMVKYLACDFISHTRCIEVRVPAVPGLLALEAPA